MIIVSIDSGLERTGFAVFDKHEKHNQGFKLLESGRILSPKNLSISERLLHIYNEIEKIITKFRPKQIVLERLFFFKNQKTVISVSQAQGAVLLLAAKKNIKVDFLSPPQIKEIITGYGQADKKAVQKMLRLTVGINIPSSHDDEADAIACGLAYCYLNKKLVE